MAEVTLSYEPREWFMPLHQRHQRWACLVVHRRGGKTVACVNELLTRATYTNKKNARYAYIAPFYRQAKDVAWQYVKEFGEGVITKIRESELRVELFNGAWITLYGADNPDALRGLYLDGVVLDEYGDCRPSLWGTVVLPTLADRKGWAIFIGTPKGKNHFYEVHERSKKDEGWFSLTLPASVSGILDDEELKEMRAQMSEESYNQEMECDFLAAVAGTYYASLIQKLEVNHQIAVNAAEYDPNQKVWVSADLGVSDSTAFWFWQPRPGGYAIIDYYENQGRPLEHYLGYLDDTGYEFDTLWLPHDARAKTLQTGRSTVEQVAKHFGKHHPEAHIQVAPRLDVQHGIEAVRLILPCCYFNQAKCYAGIEALRAYRRTYDETKKAFGEKPVHDWSSDGADAFRYFAMACQPMQLPDKTAPRIRRATFTPRYTLDKLWEDHEKSGSHSFEKLRIG